MLPLIHSCCILGAQVDVAVNALSGVLPRPLSGTAVQRLTGRWRLLYTTERSVHALVNGGLLGLRVQDVTQNVELDDRSGLCLCVCVLEGIMRI